MDDLNLREILLNEWENRLIQWEKQLNEKEKYYKLALAYKNGNVKYLLENNDYDYIDTEQIQSL